MTTCHDIYPYDEYAGDQPAAERRIVVGVDPSVASAAALRWAAEQARTSHARLEAVRVYQPDPYLSFAFGDYPAVAPLGVEQSRVAAMAELRQSVAAALPEGSAPSVDLVLIAHAIPSKALTRHARDATMLVLGAHHRRGLGVLLGSTAASCVRQASCPVVVVPATATDTADHAPATARTRV